MFYTIVFWFAVGFIVASLFLLWVVAELAKRGRLFMKEESGKWIPKVPII